MDLRAVIVVILVVMVAGCGSIGDTAETPTPPQHNDTDSPAADADVTPTPTATTPDVERLRPVHPAVEVSVQPETPVLFRVDREGEDTLDPDDVVWEVFEHDAASDEWVEADPQSTSLAPFEAALADATGHGVRSSVFEPGTYRVSAIEYDDRGEPTAAVNWTVEATRDAASPASLEATTPRDTTIYFDETPSFAVELDDAVVPVQVYWWGDRCETIASADTVFEAGDTVATTYPTDQYRSCPLSAVAVDDAGMVAIAADARNLTLAPPLDVGVQDTNDPVARGEPLEVTAETENVGTEPHETTVSLWVEDVGQVDNTTLEVHAGETRTVELAYDTADEDRDRFDISVAITSQEYTVSDGRSVRMRED